MIINDSFSALKLNKPKNFISAGKILLRASLVCRTESFEDEVKKGRVTLHWKELQKSFLMGLSGRMPRDSVSMSGN